MKEIYKEAYFEKLKRLSNISNTGERDNSLKNMTLHECVKAGDNKWYGIVQENSHYYIKTAISKTTPDVSEFVYIGGLENKLEERKPSLQAAQKRLSAKIQAINEVYGAPLKEEDDNEEAVEMPNNTDNVGNNTSTENIPSTSEETPETASEDGDKPAETTQDTETTTPTEPTEPTGDESVESNNDSNNKMEIDDDTLKELQSELGKFTQKVRSLELNDDMTKNILNSIISAIDFKKLTDEDIEDFIMRFKTRGKKIKDKFDENKECDLYQEEKEWTLEADVEELPAEEPVVNAPGETDTPIVDAVSDGSKTKEVKIDLGANTIEMHLKEALSKYIELRIDEEMKKLDNKK